MLNTRDQLAMHFLALQSNLTTPFMEPQSVVNKAFAWADEFIRQSHGKTSPSHGRGGSKPKTMKKTQRPHVLEHQHKPNKSARKPRQFTKETKALLVSKQIMRDRLGKKVNNLRSWAKDKHIPFMTLVQPQRMPKNVVKAVEHEGVIVPAALRA